jgi:hypothetical protein
MIKPNFYIIGTVKCATTTLAQLLGDHPEAAIVKGKEPHFFSMEKSYSRGLDAYLSLYSHCTTEIAIGDASTSYSRIRYHPKTIERIHNFTPDAKIIFMVRHPLERMESAYAERIVTQSAEHRASLSESVRQIPMMVDSSRYWEVFDAYRQTFPEENIKVVWFEDFTQNQQQVFPEICRFLGINDKLGVTSNTLQTNSRAVKEKQVAARGQSLQNFDTEWDSETRAYAINELREDNLKILRYFGKPDDYWGDIFA